MNDEKNLNEELNEEVNEETQPTVEEVNEEPVAEATEEVVAETVEAPVEEAETENAEEEAVEAPVEEVAEVVAEADAEADTENVLNAENDEPVVADFDWSVSQPAKKNNLPIILIAAAILVIAAIVVLAVKFSPVLFNKYNRLGYVDVSGRTVEQVADEQGMDLDEFLEQFNLPEDMPGNTTESAAYNCIPVSTMVTMYGMEFDTMKEFLKFPDTVTEDTPWGEAIGEVTLGNYVGEDNLAEFKETYGLGDDVTVDTLWKEVRQTVDETSRQQRIESEKAEAEADKNADKEDDEAEEATASPEATEASDKADTTEE